LLYASCNSFNLTKFSFNLTKFSQIKKGGYNKSKLYHHSTSISLTLWSLQLAQVQFLQVMMGCWTHHGTYENWSRGHMKSNRISARDHYGCFGWDHFSSWTSTYQFHTQHFIQFWLQRKNSGLWQSGHVVEDFPLISECDCV